MLLRRFTLLVCSTAVSFACGDGMDQQSGTGGSAGEFASGGSVQGTGGSRSAPSGGASSSGGSETVGPADCARGLNHSSYTYDLNLPPSQLPPGGLAVESAPLFVSIGFDDNSNNAGMQWATKMLADRGVRSSFFHTSSYLDAARSSWQAAHEAGFEVGLHTHDHPHGTSASASDWTSQITTNISLLSDASGGLGVPRSELYGFRSPFLEYNDELFDVLESQGVWYDCSIEEGFDASQDGSNLFWPYTLDRGSPGHDYNKGLGIPTRQFTVGSHPGVLELPVYMLLVPDDSLAESYGFSPGLRTRMAAVVPDFVEFGYKITGFDWNLWSQAGLSGPEVTALLKYNLDQRRAGNRAPLLFGAHTDQYSSSLEKQKAIEDFLDYAAGFEEVRIVSFKEVVDFLREPKPLDCY